MAGAARVAAVERPEAPASNLSATAPDPAEVVGRRIGAALLDILVLAVVFVVLGLALGEGETTDGGAEITLETGGTLLYLAIVLGYYFATEAAWGQTLGKKALGLTVVTTDGAPAGVGAVALRTVLRLIDSLPFLYLLGFIVMLATKRKQRLGDLAAGTTVTRATSRPG